MAFLQKLKKGLMSPFAPSKSGMQSKKDEEMKKANLAATGGSVVGAMKKRKAMLDQASK